MQFTFNFLFHFKVVLKEEHVIIVGEAAAEHAIVLDALLVAVRPCLVWNGRVGHISGKVHPVWCQKADAAGQKREGQQKKSDGACQAHRNGLCADDLLHVSTCNVHRRTN